jgi:hypothetical protein
MNKILFTGCSWSWGQGLELASPTSYGVDWEGRGQQWNKLSSEQMEFIQTNRWSKLVSNRLGLEEVNLSQPGNSNGKSLSTLVEYIENRGINDVDSIVFQLTHPFRSFAFKTEGITPTTGMEFALLIESELNRNRLDLDWLSEMSKKLDENFELLSERHLIFLEELTKWFDGLKGKYPNLKIHLIEWISEVNTPIVENPYYVNLFGGKSVMEWSMENELTGTDWMRKNGFKLLFTEGHLSIDGMEIFTDILYDKIKPLYL